AGHRRIACLQGLPASIANGERVAGYRAELKALGLRAAAAWLDGGDYTVESGRSGTELLLALREPPTAILALGNLLALGALEALRVAGRRVPADVSVVSFDEQPWAASLAPPLTTIAQPVADMGSAAMRLLFTGLDAKAASAPSARVVLPFTVIERESVGGLL
ncbi:MAG: substrate-binding domain-containing protein, partial [Burkholderiales bacterium]|nr:substrate-binding domain-containing protein [Opitutaceae bacterium]